jgi:hypothetical protein
MCQTKTYAMQGKELHEFKVSDAVNANVIESLQNHSITPIQI